MSRGKDTVEKGHSDIRYSHARDLADYIEGSPPIE